MKRSTRRILLTILALNGVIVLYTVIGRLTAINAEPRPTRTPAEQLAELRDFTIIRGEGDFSLEVVQQADFSVEFTPAGASTGSLRTFRRNNELVIFGQNNPPDGKLRIGLPVLEEVTMETASITISGFAGEKLLVRGEGVPQIVLLNNDIEQWSVTAGGRSEVQVDQTTMANGKIRMLGQGVISVIQ
ncbi:MAG: hypothetical protein V4603_12730 [Pseudomonadota bacterium]